MFPDDQIPFGTHTVTWTVEDIHGNTNNCSQSIVVEHYTTTTTVLLNASSIRYMDEIIFSAQINTNCDNNLTGSVEFYIGGVSYGTSIVEPLTTDPSVVQAILVKQVAEIPGNYTVTAIFTPSNTDYLGSTGTTDLNVRQRNADPYDVTSGFYTGTLLAWTTGENSSTGTITLASVIKDNNTPDGDMRNAVVTFWMEDSNGNLKEISGGKDLPVGLVDMTDSKIGIASADVQFDIGNSQQERYPIYVEVKGAYTNGFDPQNPGSFDAYVTVAKPVPGGSIAGSGLMTNEDSKGQLEGATGHKTSFAFDVTYNKKKTNPQGKMVIWFESYYRSDGTLDDRIHYYKISSNAINLLVMGGDDFEGGKLESGHAIFDAKANLAEKINGLYTGIEGNSPLHVTMTDPDPNSDDDDETIGITYFNSSGGIWFTSNYSLVENAITEEQLLDPGADNYIEVKPDGTTSGGSSPKPGKNKSTEIATANESSMIVQEFRLSLYPNPSKGDVIVEFESPSNLNGEILVRAINGQEILRKEFRETKRVELDLKDQVSGIYLIQIETNNQFYMRKLILKRE